MVIEEALYSHLTGDPTVGGLISTRQYPLTIPQDVSLPSVAYQRLSGPGETAHDGAVGVEGGRFQFTCQAQGYDDVKELANAVREALIGFKGLMGGSGGVLVDGCFVLNELDGYGMVAGVYTVRLDMAIHYRE